MRDYTSAGGPRAELPLLGPVMCALRSGEERVWKCDQSGGEGRKRPQVSSPLFSCAGLFPRSGEMERALGWVRQVNL